MLHLPEPVALCVTVIVANTTNTTSIWPPVVHIYIDYLRQFLEKPLHNLYIQFSLKTSEVFFLLV